MTGLAGCSFIYIAPMHQGNYLSPAMMHKVKIGMTQSQVSYVLGPPALNNPFSAHHWVYIYYRKASHSSAARLHHLWIVFHQGRVIRILHRGHLLPANPATH
jgi:outer membrane protein assembly factor BamE